ncbi:MAG: hypothetical protein CMK96_09665 [Pseudomonas sp.]|jgi:hypothetical protein|nr:hypothetical protein [Pseudomonas sp.]|tara:strand:- start:419 stop:763 length:345 start_codon:yes stop_codon:yes gene_type:complete
MNRCPSALAAVRVALAQPFADPVNVGGIPMRRAEARELERILTSKPARLSQDATASAARSLFPLADGGATQSPALSMAGRTAEASLSSTAGLRGASHRPVHDRSCERKGQHDHV